AAARRVVGRISGRARGRAAVSPRKKGARAGGASKARARTDGKSMRRHVRKVVELPVLVTEAESRVRGGIRFDTQDLSLGGAFLRSDLLFEVGEEVEVEFQLVRGPKVRARARVVRVVREHTDGQPGMGIAFTDLSESDREAVRAYLARAG